MEEKIETMSTEIVIKDLKSQALTMQEKAKGIQIIDDETLHMANEFMHGCRQLEKKIDDKMDPLIKKSNELHRDTLATKREMKDPITQARETVDPKIISYKHKIEEEIRVREEEKARKIEEERKKKEEALEKAATAEKAGDEEKAEEEFKKAEKSEEEETLLSLEPKFKVKAPETKGTATVRYWKFRVKNLKLVPRELLKLDEVKIGHIARTQKEKAEVPGIEFYYTESSSIRG